MYSFFLFLKTIPRERVRKCEVGGCSHARSFAQIAELVIRGRGAFSGVALGVIVVAIGAAFATTWDAAGGGGAAGAEVKALLVG